MTRPRAGSLRTRIGVAWRVLRGWSVMYRCHIVLDVERSRLIVGPHHPGSRGRLAAIGNIATLQATGDGELYVFDCLTGISYPLVFDGPVT